ncbi:MAG: DUF378 domain-containing protein [Parcubacteria group bacterium]|jgi:hypothetical protein
MQKLNALDWVAVVLVVIGGLNWGLVGLFGFNLVDTIFGVMGAISRVVYVVVGLASLYLVFSVSSWGKQ